MFDKYQVKLTFARSVLATNPCDPNVMDVHIQDKQRKLILEKGGINTQINKYLDEIQISKEKGAEETSRLIDRLETLIGYTLSPEERQDAIAGTLTSLKETFEEMDVKGTTIFFWDKKADRPCLGSHMIKGYLKAAAEAIGRTLPTKHGTVLHSISYTQSLINQHVSCVEEFITFDRDIVRKEDGTTDYLQRSLRAMTAKGPRISLAKSEQVAAGAKLEFTLRVMQNSPITKEILCKLFDYGELSGIGQWRNSGRGAFSYELMKA
jgi:hypothetical protein